MLKIARSLVTRCALAGAVWLAHPVGSALADDDFLTPAVNLVFGFDAHSTVFAPSKDNRCVFTGRFTKDPSEGLSVYTLMNPFRGGPDSFTETVDLRLVNINDVREIPVPMDGAGNYLVIKSPNDFVTFVSSGNEKVAMKELSLFEKKYAELNRVSGALSYIAQSGCTQQSPF